MTNDSRQRAPSRTPLILDVLRGEVVERAPVWLMRQAGRYLREYQAVKEKHTFLEMCKQPELAVEVTMQPLRVLNVDAAIVFSDILIPLEALGFEIDFRPGPVVGNKIAIAGDIRSLGPVDITGVSGPVCVTLRELRKLLEGESRNRRRGLLGFAGAPWTLACYLIDQGPFKHFQGTSVFANSRPAEFMQLMEVLAELVADYLIAQAEAGADAVQIFDSWGGNLSIEDYERFSAPSIAFIAERLRAKGIPRILYVGNGSHLLSVLSHLPVNCLSLDWRVSLAEARRLLPPHMMVQGNLDPTVLFSSPQHIRDRTATMLAGVNTRRGFIANLGHGVLPLTPRENVVEFVNTIYEHGGVG